MSFNLVLLASGNGSNCQAIIDACARGEIKATIRALISDNADAFALQRARDAGITTIVVARQDFATNAEFHAALCAKLHSLTPDLIVLAGFMRILPATTVQAFPDRIINIHPSLLPEFPGLDTHARALAASKQEHGTSVHLVTEALDAGPLIAQAKCKVLPDDTAETLKQRVQALEHQLYPRVIAEFASGCLKVSDNRPLKNGKLLIDPTCEI